jgi:hypothetical protein
MRKAFLVWRRGATVVCLVLLSACSRGEPDPVRFQSSAVTVPQLRSWSDYYPMARGQARGQRAGHAWETTPRNNNVGAQLTFRLDAYPLLASNAPATAPFPNSNNPPLAHRQLPSQESAFVYQGINFSDAHPVEYYYNWYCSVFDPTNPESCADIDPYVEVISESPGGSYWLELWGAGNAAPFTVSYDLSACSMPLDNRWLQDPQMRRPLLYAAPAAGQPEVVGPPICSVKLNSRSLDVSQVVASSVVPTYTVTSIVSEDGPVLTLQNLVYSQVAPGVCLTPPDGQVARRNDWGFDACFTFVEVYSMRKIGADRLANGFFAWGPTRSDPADSYDRTYRVGVTGFSMDNCSFPQSGSQLNCSAAPDCGPCGELSNGFCSQKPDGSACGGNPILSCYGGSCVETLDDVSPGTPYHDAVVDMYRRGITLGCGPNPANGHPKYCPNDLLTRAQMAIFVVRARNAINRSNPAIPDPNRPDLAHGLLAASPDYFLCRNPAGTYVACDDASVPQRFTDVGRGYWAYKWIQKLADLGITHGCNDGTTFCPDATLALADSTVFVERGAYGCSNDFVCEPYIASLAPPGQLFSDVPPPNPANPQTTDLYYPFIQVSGNQGFWCGKQDFSGFPEGRYGLFDTITRGQVSLLLERAFFSWPRCNSFEF